MTAPDRMAGGEGTVEAPARKHIVHREAAFQEVAVPFVRKVMMQPAFVTAVVNENEMTENARARAKRRGMVSGFPDLLMFQHPGKICGVELKWGKNTPSDAQKDVASHLNACGIYRGYAWSIHEILANLRGAGFTLHGGAEVLATEYQARAEAAVRKAELNAEAKNTGASPTLYKQRSRAPTPSRLRQWAKIQKTSMLQDPYR